LQAENFIGKKNRKKSKKLVEGEKQNPIKSKIFWWKTKKEELQIKKIPGGL